MFRTDSAACVLYGNTDGRTLAGFNFRCFVCKSAAPGHGFNRIEGNINHDLKHLLLIDIDHRQFLLELLENGSIFGHAIRGDNGNCLENNRVNVLRPDIAARGTGIIQKLADDGVQPVDFIDDYFQKLLLLFCRSFGLKELCRALD